ncbi:hypothetical protein IV203_027172 [Nitzschia inconspicua]|uniref:Uncharacterized protein n=1 Tax=Nitzschia inconspicua TaxID=303405 RepID=A0A9K3LNW1_9STRA|nr:hypothetical protein IV203_027172 [Nitzschia inconspicua]
MPDGTTVRHYHTHNNNQTYNIYVTGGLAAAGLTKQAGQATDGSPDRSVLQKSPTHATLSSPNDGESFSKPNSHALRANPTSAFYSPPKRPGSVSFPLGRSDSATAVTASLDNNKESTTNISSDIILVGDSATVDTASLDNNKENIKNIASDIVSADSTPSGVPTSTVHDDRTPSCVSTSKMNVSHTRRRMSRTSRRKVVRYQPYPEQSQTATHHGGIRDESNIQCYPVFDNNPTPEGDAEERELTEVEEREIQYNWFH